jgi:hypothetical protein
LPSSLKTRIGTSNNSLALFTISAKPSRETRSSSVMLPPSVSSSSVLGGMVGAAGEAITRPPA